MYTLIRALWRQAIYRVAAFIADQTGRHRPTTMGEALALIGRTWLGIAAIIAATILAISALIFLWYVGTLALGILMGLPALLAGGTAIGLGLGGNNGGAFISLLIFLLFGAATWWLLGFWGRRRLRRRGFAPGLASTIWWKRGAAVALLVAVPVFFLQFTPVAGWLLLLLAVGFITMTLAIASGRKGLASLVGVVLVIAFAISLIPAPTIQWMQGEVAEQIPSYRFDPETRKSQRKYSVDPETGEVEETKNLHWNFNPETAEPLHDLTPAAYREVRGQSFQTCRFNWRKPEETAGRNPKMRWADETSWPAEVTRLDKCHFEFTVYPAIAGVSREIKAGWNRCTSSEGWWRQESPPDWGTWKLEEKSSGFFEGYHTDRNGVKAATVIHCQ
jgi:flagellin-like protein